ncbi:uncharacterized protein [Miscanthus floridulus]|uniref:uncharacterized protein n=1 Tax=Miscanthus floridulus TaxID=154761 RepID=UPI00345A8293
MAETEADRKAREEREQRARDAAEANRAAALDAYEAKHAAVHAAAIAVLNIKVLVPLVLDRAADNYTRWRSMFLTVLGKYALTDHVLSDVANVDRSAWVQMDCTVLTWIYCTIHADLLQSTMNRKPTARSTWTYLEHEFLGQRESRALLLSAEFCNARQGSASITDFCRRLETMAATLRDYGDPIGDRTMVFTLLRGLNGKFRPMVSNLKIRQPFPTFEEARTLLLLEEIDIDDIAAGEAAGVSDPPASSAPTALVATPRSSNGRGGYGPGGQSGSGQGAGHGQPGHGQGGYGGHGQGGSGGQGGSQRSGRRRGGRGHNQQQQQAGGPRPPASFYNPWAGHVQFWLCPPNGSGTPFCPPPAAFTAQQQYTPQPYAFSPPPGFGYGAAPPPQQQQQPWTPLQGMSWDPSALVSNFNTMTLTPPPSGEWYDDSGAGAHMVNNAGGMDAAPGTPAVVPGVSASGSHHTGGHSQPSLGGSSAGSASSLAGHGGPEQASPGSSSGGHGGPEQAGHGSSSGASPAGPDGAAAPTDSSSQVVASGTGRTIGRTTATVPEAIVLVTNAHSMRTRGKDGFR